MVDSSQTRLSAIPEVTYGVTPATPVFKNIRFTDEDLDAKIQYVSSNEIRSDANVSDLTQVGSDAGGGFGFELSYASFDDYLEALLRGTWASNILVNGVTDRSFTIEKFFEAGATDQYQRYIGCRFDTLSLNIESNQKVTGKFGVMAKGMTSAQAIIAGATYTASNTNPIINAAANFASLTMTGVSSPAIKSIGLEIKNNMRQQPVVGSIQSKGIGTGRFEVNGTMRMYFENNAALDLYLQNTSTDLSFVLGGVSTLKYTIQLPKLKFTAFKVVAGANDTDVIADISFQAYYDATTLGTMKITRTP